MLAKRIIPCLDIHDGKTVKGVQFQNLKEMGDPVELAKKYSEEGADELVFLDISATHEGRKTLLDWVKKVASAIQIPFTVGGGIKCMEDAIAVLDSGADKISLNSAAFRNPTLITDLASRYGSQCVVLAIDVKKEPAMYEVYLQGGRMATGRDALHWAIEGVEKGAGEILLTSMDRDGSGIGFDCELYAIFAQKLNVPIIASGGAGTMQHFKSVLIEGKADAALAAGLFHRGEVSLPMVKRFLRKSGINIRL